MPLEDEVGGGGTGGRLARAVANGGAVGETAIESARFFGGGDEESEAHDW
jgi:hypothetical protein